VSDEQALKRLEPFIGTWSLSADFPNMAEPVPDVDGRAVFEWLLDGKFLVERSEVDHPDAPNGFVIIAPDGEVAGSYKEHYFDSRGVVRTYAMTFDGRTWTLKRETADFSPLDFKQRYTGIFADDGKSINGRWEICHDGENWEHDFDLNYTKVD
jgi:hypothetical protein